MKQRVVITGAGVTSTLGFSRQELFQALLAGRSAVKLRPDWTEQMQGNPRVVAASVELPEEQIKSIKRHYRRSMGPSSLFAALAARQLIAETGLTQEELSSGRIGCIASSTLGSPTETYAAAMAIVNNSFYDQSACQFFKIVSHSTAFNVANMLGINGVQLSPCSACASSLQSIGLAYEQLLLGRQDLILAGGSDEVAPIVLESFRLLHALGEEPGFAPEEISRPFDAKRCGLVCGEGAALLAVETLEHTIARGAKPLAEIIGYATSCTGAQISQSDSASIVRCMKLALEDAGLAPQEVDYVSAHATSTVAGDREEATAIRELFGDAVPVSSLKGQLGHTLGASGALETAVLLEMFSQGLILPNTNLTAPSEECAGLNLIRKPLERSPNIILKNCIAFGGVNATLIIKKI